MAILKYLFIAILAASTVSAATMTANKFGARDVKHPMGISLKQESVRQGGYLHSTGRSHYGGGLRTHK